MHTEHKARTIAAGVDAEVLLSCCIIRRCRAAVEPGDELRPSSCQIVRETVRVPLLVSTGPAIDSRECLGDVVSNGRIFYTSQASGFVVSQTYGLESADLPPAWEVR